MRTLSRHVTCLTRSESGGGAGGAFARRHLVLASELAPSHRAPRPFLGFAGRIRRPLRCIQVSNLSGAAPRQLASSSAPSPVLMHLASTSRPPLFNRPDAISCQRAGVLSCIDARELRWHLAASIFQPTGRHFSPACRRAHSCRRTRVASAPRSLRSSTRTSRTPLPASLSTRWCTLSGPPWLIVRVDVLFHSRVIPCSSM
jgi:hypothetical protein